MTTWTRRTTAGTKGAGREPFGACSGLRAAGLGDHPGPHLLEKWFANGEYPALVVILGPVSGNVCCRDFDDALAYPRWAKKHPELAKVLPTAKTGRGFHVYFVCQLTKTLHLPDGELRAGRGALCVLPPSKHSSGARYEWIVPLPNGALPKLDASEVEKLASPMPHKQAEASASKHKQSQASRGKKKSMGGSDEVDLAIEATLPDRPGVRNQLIFQLARALKGIPQLAELEASEVCPIVEEWHRRALPYINTKELEETLFDFVYAWPRIAMPFRPNLVEETMQAARANPMENLPYPGQGIRDLAAFCRELQGMWGDAPFYLSAHVAGRVLGVAAKTAWRWLFVLEADGWLEMVEKGGFRGGRRIATRFRFTGAGRTADSVAPAK